MANYAFTTTVYEDKQYQNVLAQMEAAAEALVNTKVIHLYSIIYRSYEDTFVGTVVADT